mgnify:FL=1
MRNHEISNELDDPLSSGKIGAYSGSIKAKFYKSGKLYKDIPPVDIHSELRSILCNSKIKIKPYSVSYDRGCLVIDLPNNIKGSLANLIIVKTLTTVGLKYKCVSCKLEIDKISKTICFHY